MDGSSCLDVSNDESKDEFFQAEWLTVDDCGIP
jgi:hypothetical protein